MTLVDGHWFSEVGDLEFLSLHQLLVDEAVSCSTVNESLNREGSMYGGIFKVDVDPQVLVFFDLGGS